MSDFSDHTHNNPPMMSLKESTARPTFHPHVLPGDATSKSLHSPNSMDISSIISPPQSTWQQTQPHPIDTDSLVVSLPSPQTSVPVLTTGKSPAFPPPPPTPLALGNPSRVRLRLPTTLGELVVVANF